MENSEHQLAVIEAFGNCDLYITDKRLVVIKKSSYSTGGLIGGILGGVIGGAIGSTIQREIESKKKEDEQVCSKINELLKKDKKNYDISYDDLYSVKLSKIQWSKLKSATLTINSKKGLYVLKLSNEQVEQLSKLLPTISALNGKIS